MTLVVTRFGVLPMQDEYQSNTLLMRGARLRSAHASSEGIVDLGAGDMYTFLVFHISMLR